MKRWGLNLGSGGTTNDMAQHYKKRQRIARKNAIRNLIDQGMTNIEIAEKLNIPELTVSWHRRTYRADKAVESAPNVDRHLCKTCKYKAKGSGCDYFCKTDKVRGCDPEYCNKWEEK